SYTVTAADSLCYTTSITVPIPDPPKLQAPIKQNWACDCRASGTATPKFGDGNFTYIWDNGQTTKTAFGLCPGTHSVTVTDSTCAPAVGTTFVHKVDPIKIADFKI